MDIEKVRNYCLSKPETTESFPFDDVTLVFKVVGKIFAITSLDRQPMSINLKCDPEKAVELRETYTAISPGYHMNKTHWNTLSLDSSLSSSLVQELIDHSYDMVVATLKKNDRERIKALLLRSI